ncbi:unnamed protein product [Acanthosepion pharaonis]|uniref:Uncharacterized protein n=1 Tax=Acanthosepion pharaonis TaxID=158019 RepID=A0A812D5Y7_ACAPH|nr:unnamed protein product [Sepia pharaonis]
MQHYALPAELDSFTQQLLLTHPYQATHHNDWCPHHVTQYDIFLSDVYTRIMKNLRLFLFIFIFVRAVPSFGFCLLLTSGDCVSGEILHTHNPASIVFCPHSHPPFSSGFYSFFRLSIRMVSEIHSAMVFLVTSLCLMFIFFLLLFDLQLSMSFFPFFSFIPALSFVFLFTLTPLSILCSPLHFSFFFHVVLLPFLSTKEFNVSLSNKPPSFIYSSFAV